MSSFAAEYEAFAAGKRAIELAGWSTVVMTGTDRQTFLHNMCTNDIKGLQPGDRCEAFCTDVKGKIVAQVFVIAAEDQLDLVTVPGQAATLIAHLDRYIIREDVTLTDATDERTWCFEGGGDSARVVARFCTEGKGKLSGTALWNAVRIEAGLPLLGVDFDRTNLPQEVNRDAEAISFNKGCYLGQETIARIDALGHVNQKVVRLQFTGEDVPPVGLELTSSGKTVGRVTSSCWSPKFESPLALAMVRRGSNELESAVETDHNTGIVVSLI